MIIFFILYDNDSLKNTKAKNDNGAFIKDVRPTPPRGEGGHRFLEVQNRKNVMRHFVLFLLKIINAYKSFGFLVFVSMLSCV